MRIVKRTEFLTLPVGTVFSSYRPCICTGLSIKGESLSNDFFEVSLIGAVDASGSDEEVERLDAMTDKGASFPAEFNIEGRDGMFDPPDTLFAVYEPADVEALIVRLQMAMRGESIYTLEKAAREK